VQLRQAGALAGSLPGPLATAASLLRAHAARLAEARREVDALRVRYDELVVSRRCERDAVRGRADLPASLRELLLRDVELAGEAELARLRARHRQLLLDVADDARRTARQVGAVAADVVPGRPPVEGVPSWWADLPTAEQDRWLALRPRRLGGLDGLPAAVRSRANEAALTRRLTGLRSLPTRTPAQARRLENCLAVRRTLRALWSRRDPVTGGALTVQLLVFAPGAFGGEGRVVVGVGDVDTARNLAVLVPGLDSSVRAGLRGLAGRAERVRTEAGLADPASPTATVAWLGYDAPGLASVFSDAAAERGADLLAADLLALQPGRAAPPRLTVVGNSYGSTTVGTALRDHRTGADAAVLVGSPGPNVETAAELRLPHGRVFVGASSRDPVSYLDRFGADPSHEDFGAVRFRAEDVTRNPLRLDFGDHLKYFDPGTESLSNVARVVVGDYDAVRRADYRGEAWLRPDGINDDPEADREPTRR
jgi:hypothetical protein